MTQEGFFVCGQTSLGLNLWDLVGLLGLMQAAAFFCSALIDIHIVIENAGSPHALFVICRNFFWLRQRAGQVVSKILTSSASSVRPRIIHTAIKILQRWIAFVHLRAGGQLIITEHVYK